MAESSYQELANSLAAFSWSAPTDQEHWRGNNGKRVATKDEIMTAALIDIMISLRAVRNVLECPRVARAAAATDRIHKLILAHLKPKKSKSKKTKRRSK